MTELSQTINHTIKEYRGVRSYKDIPDDEAEMVGRCIESAFGGVVDETDAKNHMAGDQILIAFHQPDQAPIEVAGFSATSIGSPSEIMQAEKLPSHPGLYFAAAAVAKHHQGTGLYVTLNDRRLELLHDNDLDVIFTRTQNPRVEDGITNAVERLINSGEARSYSIGRTAMLGVYGKMLTDKRPLSRSSTYDNLDYEQGDANLITWQLHK